MSSSASETSETPSTGISNCKSICIVIVVIGCFAVLWPKIFYPMLLYGIRWDTRQSIDNANKYILPPKVMEAMRQSPTKNPQPQKLPGRPQFYTGKREISTNIGGGQNSVWNIFVPLYALILIVIFMYALFKLSLKSDDIQSTTIRGSRLQLRQQSSWSSLHDPKQCRECQYDLVRQEYTNKRYDPFMSRSSYRTFDYYGRRNVSRIMHSLVEDVKTFSEHLTKTEKCSCKLAKYDKDGNEAESFLKTNKQINDEPIKQNKEDNEQQQQQQQQLKQQDSVIVIEENLTIENPYIDNIKENVDVTAAQQDHKDDNDDDIEQIHHTMTDECHENDGQNSNENVRENKENIIEQQQPNATNVMTNFKNSNINRKVRGRNWSEELITN
ncbi:hypothetical protein DERF_002139 [Dermatophagoides farinae]|uniref:Resistance to inhibitors of cholinesterase protein 3 N-terminal domain-containing protein n=1 Tax=Dermatophagoides farinae TaxID=6954 RepID=A0A922IBU9_DERFA|nr:hypothetical protein HUG17_7031 [Dermatophagoides farinae]KAH9528170.1 hypothetical protein DERF_002139 [Dermatophagoides farinae]